MTAAPAEICPANASTLDAAIALLESLAANALYGPGRGIWDGDRYVVTYAPGRRSKATDVKTWPNAKGKLYPSLHCTSLCNVFLAWLTRRNEQFTHAGNIPEIDRLVAASPDPHTEPGVGTWRGYGDVCFAIAPDGTGAARSKVPKVLDMRELLNRAKLQSLPTFMVFGQSTLRSGKWMWWHHTGVLVAYDGKLYRCAADGYRGAGGYSATPVSFTEVTERTVANYAAAVYRVWGVDTADGSYGPPDRPIARVEFET